MEPPQKRIRHVPAADANYSRFADGEPRITRLMFLDGAACAGERCLLYNLKNKLEEAEYNVYVVPNMTDRSDTMVNSLKETLLRICLITRCNADCRGANWDSLLKCLRETIDYEFNHRIKQVEAMVEVCKMIETERQHAKTVLASEACPSAEEMELLFRLRNPVVILIRGGLFTTCSLMLGLCHLCPMKFDMKPEQRTTWQDIMDQSRCNSRQLITTMLEAIRGCTTNLDVHGAMIGLLGGKQTMDEFISGIVTRSRDRKSAEQSMP
jgi:hypothetical protein